LLCIADNRPVIGETGLIELISPLLTNIFAQPIHYLCVGIIKNLCGLCGIICYFDFYIYFNIYYIFIY